MQAERYLNHPGEIAAFATKDLQFAICSCPLSDKQMNIAMGGAGMWGVDSNCDPSRRFDYKSLQRNLTGFRGLGLRGLGV